MGQLVPSKLLVWGVRPRRRSAATGRAQLLWPRMRWCSRRSASWNRGVAVALAANDAAVDLEATAFGLTHGIPINVFS
jgi:hypothetical protein